MARATITPIFPGRNGAVAQSGTANVVLNGQQILAGDIDGTIFLVSNSSGGSGTVTFSAAGASSTAAWMKGAGDLVVTVANGATQVIGPLESARFENVDGMIYIDTSVVMTVTAIQIP